MAGVFPRAECLRDFRTPEGPKEDSLIIIIIIIIINEYQVLSRGNLIPSLSCTSCNSLFIVWWECHRFTAFTTIVSSCICLICKNTKKVKEKHLPAVCLVHVILALSHLEKTKHACACEMCTRAPLLQALSLKRNLVVRFFSSRLGLNASVSRSAQRLSGTVTLVQRCHVGIYSHCMSVSSQVI